MKTRRTIENLEKKMKYPAAYSMHLLYNLVQLQKYYGSYWTNEDTQMIREYDSGRTRTYQEASGS